MAYSVEFRTVNLTQILWGAVTWVAVSVVALGRAVGGWQARRAALVTSAVVRGRRRPVCRPSNDGHRRRRVPVSGYPVLLEGRAISALVVGGGRVALRKVRDLLAAGGRVRVIAPSLIDDLVALEGRTKDLTIVRRRFRDGDIDDATLVIAATDDRSVNARVATARARRSTGSSA